MLNDCSVGNSVGSQLPSSVKLNRPFLYHGIFLNLEVGDHVQAVVRGNPPLNTVAIPPRAFRYDAVLVSPSARTIHAVKNDGDSWGCAVAACRVEGLSAVGLKILLLWREVCNGTTPPTYLQDFPTGEVHDRVDSHVYPTGRGDNCRGRGERGSRFEVLV